MGTDSNEQAKREVSGRDQVEAKFRQSFSNLGGFVNGGAAPGNAIRVVCRGQHDWMAVGTRSTLGGVREVCFGSGESYWGALVALNGSMSKNAWKVDKFQPGGG
jgi:hypothetical protein